MEVDVDLNKGSTFGATAGFAIGTNFHPYMEVSYGAGVGFNAGSMSTCYTVLLHEFENVSCNCKGSVRTKQNTSLITKYSIPECKACTESNDCKTRLTCSCNLCIVDKDYYEILDKGSFSEYLDNRDVEQKHCFQVAKTLGRKVVSGWYSWKLRRGRDIYAIAWHYRPCGCFLWEDQFVNFDELVFC